MKKILVFTLLVPLLAACKKEVSPEVLMPVAVLNIQLAAIPQTITVVGQTEGSKSVEIHARVNGLLLSQNYQEGQYLEKDALLFQIEPQPYEIIHAQAQSDLEVARLDMAKAERDSTRIKALLSKKIISQQEADNSQTQLAMAASKLRSAEAKLQAADLQLSYTQVRAPMSGLSGVARRSEGNLMMSNGDSLLTHMVQIDPVRVRFEISEQQMDLVLQAAKLKEGIELEYIQADGSMYDQKGQISYIGHALEPSSGRLLMRADFSNPEQAILPGQFVRLKMNIKLGNEVALVPQKAISQSTQGHFVYVLGAKDIVEIRAIKVGEWLQDQWMVLEGLKQGDKVIVDNLLKLRPGMVVKPVSADKNV